MRISPECARQCLDHFRGNRRRRNDAPDCRALLPGLAAHLTSNLLNIKVKLRCSRYRVRAQNGHVEGVRFCGESHGLTDYARMSLQHFGGVLGTGKCDRVLTIEMIEQIANATTDQLHAARRQNAGLHDAAQHEFSQVCSARGRFNNRRNTGKQRRCKFLQHAPARKIKGIDVYRGAELWRTNVLTDEAAIARELFNLAVEVDVVVRHFSPAFARENKHRRYAAINVGPAVFARRTRLRRQGIEFLFDGVQMLRKRLEHVAALMKRQLAKPGSAYRLGVFEHGFEIEPVAGDRGDRFA